MIESSIIKLILIIILNICFVWVWVKKESLRKKDLSKVKDKLEKKLFSKKHEKTIDFIEGGESCQAHHHIFSKKTSFAVK